jgi:hypothetical protein
LFQSFPGLLRQLPEKDYGFSIRGGFESTGLYPFNVDRVLSKLPAEESGSEEEVLSDE